MDLSRRGVLGAGAAALPAMAAAAPQPEGAWTPPAAGPFRVEEHVWIPTRDGVRLSARLWIPEGPARERSPVVFEYIPYRKRDGYRRHDDAWGPQLAGRGIAYARIDIRGSGDSEGVLTDEYSEAELDDGVQCIAWLAAQPWSTGAVGQRGISWGGINALQIAARRPPALKAILAIGCCDDRFTDDAHWIGGALGHTNLQWGTQFKLVMAGPPEPKIVGVRWEAMWRERLAAAPAILAAWISHQRFDAYWRRGSVGLDPAAIACPTYVVGGWQDTYTNAVDSLLRRLTVPRKGLVGPWGHTYPWTAQPMALDWAVEEVRWWEHWLRGVDTGIMAEPMLRAFMPYGTAEQAAPAAQPGRWIAETAWPTPAVAPMTLHLGEGGLSARPGAGRATVRGDRVVGLTKPEWLDRRPVEQALDDRNSVTFDTAPLERDIEILGRPTVTLRLSADRPVAHVAVRMTEVTPDGRSWLVGYVLRNLTHRASHTAPEALTPGAVYDVELPMAFVAHRFAKGARIRLAVSESLWPLVWPSPEGATLTLDLAGCTLQLPVRASEGAPAPMPIPVTVTPPPADWTAPTTVTAPGPDGRFVIDNDSPETAGEVAGADVTVTRGQWERSELTPGQPDGGLWRQRATRRWTRPGWDCRIEASYELTSTSTVFHLSETLKAWKDETLIFERTAGRDIPRDLV